MPDVIVVGAGVICRPTVEAHRPKLWTNGPMCTVHP